jgi:hypothetical protein
VQSEGKGCGAWNLINAKRAGFIQKNSGQHDCLHFAGEKCTLPAQLGVKVLTHWRTLFFALGISMVQSPPFLKNADPTTANHSGRRLSDLWRQLGRVVRF